MQFIPVFQKEGLLQFHFISLSESKAGAVFATFTSEQTLAWLVTTEHVQLLILLAQAQDKVGKLLHFWREPSLEQRSNSEPMLSTAWTWTHTFQVPQT